MAGQSSMASELCTVLQDITTHTHVVQLHSEACHTDAAASSASGPPLADSNEQLLADPASTADAATQPKAHEHADGNLPHATVGVPSKGNGSGTGQGPCIVTVNGHRRTHRQGQHPARTPSTVRTPQPSPCGGPRYMRRRSHQPSNRGATMDKPQPASATCHRTTGHNSSTRVIHVPVMGGL